MGDAQPKAAFKAPPMAVTQRRAQAAEAAERSRPAAGWWEPTTTSSAPPPKVPAQVPPPNRPRGDAYPRTTAKAKGPPAAPMRDDAFLTLTTSAVMKEAKAAPCAGCRDAPAGPCGVSFTRDSCLPTGVYFCRRCWHVYLGKVGARGGKDRARWTIWAMDVLNV